VIFCYNKIIMQCLQDIYSGYVCVSSGNKILRTSPLGSCIAVVTYDTASGIGGLIHIMLPGEAPADEGMKNRYAKDALRYLVGEIEDMGLQPHTFSYVVAGGANVLKERHRPVSDIIVHSVLGEMKNMLLNIVKKSVGGFDRRVVALDLNSGIVYETVGDSERRILFKYRKAKKVKEYSERL